MTTTPTHPTFSDSEEEAPPLVHLDVSPRRLDDPDSLDFDITPLRVVAVTERDIPLRILTMLKRDQLPWDSNPVLYAISRPNPHQPTSYRATPLRVQSLGEGVRAHPAGHLLGLSVVDDDSILGVCLVFEGWARSSESDSSRCEVREAVYVPKPSSGGDIEGAMHIRGCSPESFFAGEPTLHRGWLPLLLNRIVGRYPLANESVPVRSPAVLREFLFLDVPLAYLRSRVCSAHELERDPLAPLLTTDGVQAELRNFSQKAFDRWVQFFAGWFSAADLQGFPEIPVDVPLSADLWHWLGVHTCVTFLQPAGSSSRCGCGSCASHSAHVSAVGALLACDTVEEVLADDSLWQEMQDDPALSGGLNVLFGDYAEAFLQMREGLVNYISSAADAEENCTVAHWKSVTQELLHAFSNLDTETPPGLPESVSHLFPPLREWVSDRMSEDDQELMEHYLR